MEVSFSAHAKHKRKPNLRGVRKCPGDFPVSIVSKHTTFCLHMPQQCPYTERSTRLSKEDELGLLCLDGGMSPEHKLLMM